MASPLCLGNCDGPLSAFSVRFTRSSMLLTWVEKAKKKKTLNRLCMFSASENCIYLLCEWTALRLYPGRPMSWSLAAPVILAGVPKSSIDTGCAEGALERFGWERAEARL